MRRVGNVHTGSDVSRAAMLPVGLPQLQTTHLQARRRRWTCSKLWGILGRFDGAPSQPLLLRRAGLDVVLLFGVQSPFRERLFRLFVEY